MKSVMIVAAHPDDAELGMGGTIAKMASNGWDVIVADLTDGEPTPFGSKEKRERETEQAGKILGIKKRILLDMPNRYLKADLSGRRKLAEVIRKYRPDVLFGPVADDLHPDHIAAAQLVKAARFTAKLCKTDLPGEPHWASRQYCYYSIHQNFYDKPDFVIDISEYWQTKIAAINAYKSQLQNKCTGRNGTFIERVETTNKYFGQGCNVKYAEPFISTEPVCINNLDNLIP